MILLLKAGTKFLIRALEIVFEKVALLKRFVKLKIILSLQIIPSQFSKNEELLQMTSTLKTTLALIMIYQLGLKIATKI